MKLSLNSLLWLLLISLQAVSARPAVATPPTSKITPTAIPAKKVADTSNSMASRFVDQPGLASYVETLTASFSIKDRSIDPFGQLQDPNAKPIVKTPIAKTTQRSPILQATPFAEIVRLMVVNTIMPKEKKFLVGTRTVTQGDHVILNYRGRPIHVEIMDVSSQRIAFKNTDSGEIAQRKLDMLPQGMSAGHQEMAAPGMAPSGRNLPIELESGDPADELSRTPN